MWAYLKADKRFYNAVYSLRTHHSMQAESKDVVKNTNAHEDICFAPALPDASPRTHRFTLCDIHVSEDSDNAPALTNLTTP